MNGHAILGAILQDRLLEQLGPRGGVLVLREQAKNAKLRNIKVSGLAADSVVVKPDDAPPNEKLLKSAKGQLRQCDYVIFTTVQGAGHVLFIELKSTRWQDGEIAEKFKGSECLMDYCASIAEKFHGSSLMQDYKKYFILFYKIPIQKRPTRPSPPRTSGNSANTFKRYPNPGDIRIKELL